MRYVSYKVFVNGSLALETTSYQKMLAFEQENRDAGNKVSHEQILTEG